MEENSTRICELIVGLGDVEVLGVDDVAGGPLGVHIRSRARPTCAGCGGSVWSKGAAVVKLVDLAAFGRPVRLVWHKWRWRCPTAGCVVGSFTEVDDRIAPARGALTARAARWATVAVGRDARAVSDVAAELGCDWHTANRACWSGVRRCWPPTVRVWERWERWVSMRPCSGVTAGGVGATGAPRSSMCSGANCSTLSLVATPRVPPRGSSRNPRCGATASTGGCWTSPAPTGAPSKQRCRGLARSPTCSMSSAWPTTVSTRCAGTLRTTRSAAAAAGTIPCIGRDGYSFPPTNASANVATPDSAACSPPATLTARYAWRATPTKPSAASMTSTVRSSPRTHHHYE